MPQTHTRLLEFGFRHLWDTTGGDHTRSWFDQFDPQLYRFNQLAHNQGTSNIKVGRIDAVRGAPEKGYPKGKLIHGKILGRKSSFRFEPLRLRGASTEKNTNEYVRKRLFSWALHSDAEGTAALFDRNLPKFESTKREGGPPPGAKELSPLKKQIKFFWSMMRHHRALVDESGGNAYTPLEKDFGLSASEAGQGFKAPRILPTQDSFLATYQRKAVTELDIQSKILADEGLRDLLRKLGGILTIDPAARKTLKADSAEELGLRILTELEATGAYPITQPSDASLAVSQAITQVQQYYRGLGQPPRVSMLDIEPHMTGALDVIEDTMRRAGGAYATGPGSVLGQVISDIRTRGLEVSEAPNRLSQIYRINASTYGGVRGFQEALIDQIQEDIFSAYQHGGKSQMKLGPPGVDMRGIGSQFFYDRGVSIDSAGGYVWSSRASVAGNGGMFFFSIWKPAVVNTPDDIAVVGVWLPIVPTLWRNALENSSVAQFENAIRRAVVTALGGAITTQAGATLHINALGTQYGRSLSAGFASGDPQQRIATPGFLKTRVTIQPQGTVADEIYKLVKLAAVQYGNMISVAGPRPTGTPSFSQWVMSQERRGEHMAQIMDDNLSKGWSSWIYKLGGKYKPQPFKAAKDKWPQPVHPRPYLWMTAQGR